MIYGDVDENGNDTGDWFSENAPGPVMPGSVPDWSNLHNGNGPMLPGGTPLRGGVNPADIAAAGGRGGVTGNAGGPPQLNASDPASRRAFIDYYASQPGANPSLKNDPGYWDGKIASGELGSDPKYIIDKFMTPEGAPADGARQGTGFYGQEFATKPYGQQFSYPDFTEQFSYPTWDKSFTAPTLDEAKKEPGYAFVQGQGEDAILRNAAKMGVARTQGTIKDLDQFNTGLADTTYGNVYNRALSGYQQSLSDYLGGLTRAQDIYGTKVNAYNMNRGNAAQNFLTNYGVFSDDQNRALGAFTTNANVFNTGFNNNQNAQGQAFNQQYSLANFGLGATGSQAGIYTGQGNAQAGIYTGGANTQGDLTTGIGNVNAAGQVGSANAWSNAFGNIGSDLSTIYANQGKGLYKQPAPRQPVWA